MKPILHALWSPDAGSGSEGELLLWAEGLPRRAGGPGDHPSALSGAQLVHTLWQLWRSLPVNVMSDRTRKQPLLLPTRAGRPILSQEVPTDGDAVALEVWRVDVCAFAPAQILTFLLELPELSAAIDYGPSLRYWRAAALLIAAALMRGQYLPSADEEGRGRWQVLLMDPILHAQRDALAAALPPSTRALPKALPDDRTLLDGFLASVAHAHLSTAHTPTLSPFFNPKKYMPRPNEPRPADLWWIDLFSRARHNLSTLAPGPDQKAFGEAVRAWSQPIADYLDSPYRVAFRLEPPATATTIGAESVVPNVDLSASWRLSFHLQPKSSPDQLLAAAEVWASPPSPEMPAHLEAGISQAASVYPLLEEAMDEDEPVAVALTVDQAVEFLNVHAQALSARGFGVLVPTWWKDRQRRLRTRLSLGRSEGMGLMGMDALVDFNWELAVGDKTLTLDELEQLARAKTSLVQVRGEWVQFDRAEVEAALRLIKRHQQANGRIAMGEALGLALAAPQQFGGLELDGVFVDEWLSDVLERLRGGTQLERLNQPDGFVGTLRPYQVTGFSWLAFMRRFGFGACLADDMGLGKTIQLLALLARDLEDSETRWPVLLVCPTTVVNNWVRESAQFLPTLKCYAHHGPGRLRAGVFEKAVRENHLIVTSYALLPRDAEQLEAVQWGGVVLDEAHNIKNPSTKQAQIARRLRGRYKMALTGTPLENRLQDLWSIMHFLNPGYLGSAEAFQRDFAGPIERGNSERRVNGLNTNGHGADWHGAPVDEDDRADTLAIAAPDADTAVATAPASVSVAEAVLGQGPAERLRALTRPFILRRLKTDRSIIRDLPPKNEMKEYCGLTKEQAGLYRAVVQESMRQIESAQGIQRRGVILATLTRLKQVCNHPRHLLGDQSMLRGRSGKLNRLTEMLEQALAEEDRVLIFTQYAEMGELLHQHLATTFGETLYLHGGTPATRRSEMIARFQDGGPRIFVLSLKAGGAGINLTRANRVFHYDRWWNPAVENQATDRAFRIGQTQTVQVHKMICRGTLEERIDDLITRKMSLADEIVGTGEGWLTEMTTDDLRDLLMLRREAVDE